MHYEHKFQPTPAETIGNSQTSSNALATSFGTFGSGVQGPVSRRIRQLISAFTFAGLLATAATATMLFMSGSQMGGALVLLLGTGAALSSLSLYNLLKRDIAGPIESVSFALTELADGNHEVPVPWLAREDEIGSIARAAETIKRAAFKFQKLRDERDLERRQQSTMLNELADRFEKTIGEVVSSVASASSQLQLTATSMAVTAEQSTSQASEVSSNLGEASAGVTAAAAASDEFAMSIGEISRQASTSAELARDATSAASQANATIAALSESAQQVGQIVEMISKIAQRTNLLALNASIEAARGGEAGRGFAVVASEVKDLAAQTGKATEEVSNQIRAIQDTTSASVDALRMIAQQIQQLESTSVSIAAAVDQVRESSLAKGAAASQVLSSSNELQQQAAALKSKVNQFLGQIRTA